MLAIIFVVMIMMLMMIIIMIMMAGHTEKVGQPQEERLQLG